MPLTYRQVKDVHDELVRSGATSVPLAKWSSEMNRLSQSDLYSAGLSDNFIKQASVNIDRFLESTGIPQALEPYGRQVGGLVGEPEYGAELARATPRMALNFLPMFAAGPAGLPAAAGLAGTAALSGAEAYTATGSPAAGAIAAGANVLMPGVAGVAERGALRALGVKPITGRVPTTSFADVLTGGGTRAVREYIPETIPQGLISQAAGQLAAGGLGVGSDLVQRGLAGEPLEINVPQQILNLTLGQLPFAGLYATKQGRAVLGGEASRVRAAELKYATETTAKLLEIKGVQDKLKTKTKLEEVPDIIEVTPFTPEQQAEFSSRLQRLYGRQADLQKEATPLSMEEWNKVSKEINDVLAEQRGRTTDTVTGTKIDKSTERVVVAGTEVYRNAAGTYRRIRLNDDEGNGDLRGKTIGYSTRGEPTPAESDVPGMLNYSLPKGWFTEWLPTRPREVAPGHPELPEQAQPGEVTIGHYSDAEQLLKQAETDLGAAKGHADFHAARVKLNGVRESLNLLPYSDADLAAKMQKLKLNNEKATVRVAISETRRLIDERKARKTEDIAYATQLETRRQAGDPKAQQIYELRQSFIGLGGRYLQVVDQGFFDVAAKDWEASGSTNLEDLKARFPSAIEQGKGLKKVVKEEPVVQADTQVIADVKEAEKAYPREALPLIETIQTRAMDKAELITEPVDQRAYVTAVEAGDFLTARAILDDYGINFDFQRGAPRRAEPDKELTPENLATIQQIGNTGFSLWKYLSRPEADPELRALMRDLSKFSGSLERIDVTVPLKGRAAVAHQLANRRTKLSIGSNWMFTDPNIRDWVIAHELMHGLTAHEIRDPSNAKIAKQMSGLRQEAIDRLPPELKSRVNKLINDNWYIQYGFGLGDRSDLGATKEEQGLVYALLNDDEFLAQGFSHKPFQDYLKGLKTSDGQSFFHRFVNWVKEVLGFQHIDATLFEKFLSYSDQVLDQSNYVARIHNYGERYLELQGVDRDIAAKQTNRAVGVLQHNNEEVVAPVDLLMTTMAQPVASIGAYRTRQEYYRMFRESPEDADMTTSLFNELGYDNPNEAIDLLLLEAAQGFDVGPVLEVLPEAAKNYFFERATDAHQVLDVLRAMTRDKIANRLEIATPGRISVPVAEVVKTLEKILIHDTANDKAIRQIQGLTATSPGGFLDANMSLQEPIVRYALDLGDEPRAASTFMERLLEKPAQFARQHPEVAEFVSKGYQLLANSRHMALAGFRPFGLDLTNGTITHEAVKAFTKAIGNRRVSKAVDRWIYWNQKKGGDQVTTLRADDPDVARELSSLSTEERAVAIDVMAKKEASQKLMNAQILEKMLNIGAVNAATLIGPRSGLKSSQNLALAETIMKVVSTPPEVLAQDRAANAQLAMVQSKLQPDVFLDLFKFAQNEGEKWLAYKSYFEANPGWASAQRFGKFELIYRRGGKEYRDAVDSKREAKEVAQGGEIVRLERRGRYGDDDSPHIGSDFQGILTRLRELETNQIQILESGGWTPAEIQEFQKYSPVEQMAFETQYGRGVPVPDVRARRLSKGAEDLPWLGNHFSWLHKTSSFWSRQLFRAQARMLRGDPELVTRPDLQKWTQQHAANVLSPDPELARAASRFTTTWLMGMNLASAMANGTQLLVRGVAEMTALTGKPLDSYRRANRVVGEIINYYKLGGRKAGQWSNEEHAKVYEKLVHDGELNLSMYDEQAATDETMATNFKRATVRGKPFTPGEWLKDVAGKYSSVSMMAFRGVEQFNNTAASLMAFDYYREQGLSFDQAYTKAIEFNHAVNDVGGRVNRSVGLFSGKDDFSRSTAMISNSMQSYVLGSTWQLINYLKRGYFRPQGLKPHEVYAARTAAIQMLATQFAAAGTLGMPFVSGALSLLDSAFPDLEVNKNLREWMVSIFGDDEGNANLISDIALTGAPSMMGWDWQSRLSMGNTVPGVSEINGFQPELLLGAPVSIMSQFVTGAYRTATGQGRGFYGVDKGMFPPVVRKWLDLANSAGTQLTDYRDRPVLEATPGQQIGMLFGFQPKELSDLNAAARISGQSEESSKREIGQFHQGLADEIVRGNFGTVRQTLLERAQQDELYDPQEGARAVARAAEELTFVRDLRREGTSRTSEARQKLLSAFRIPSSQPTEAARFQFRQEVERRLGLAPSGADLRELRVTQLMDQLRAQRPDATRLELRRVAEAALRGPRTRTLLPVSQ